VATLSTIEHIGGQARLTIRRWGLGSAFNAAGEAVEPKRCAADGPLLSPALRVIEGLMPERCCGFSRGWGHGLVRKGWIQETDWIKRGGLYRLTDRVSVTALTGIAGRPRHRGRSAWQDRRGEGHGWRSGSRPERITVL